MCAHGSGDAFACGSCSRHVSAVGHVGATAALVRAKVVGSEDVLAVFALIFGYEDLMVARQPIVERLVAVHVAGQRIGVSCANDWFEDGPDCVGVSGLGGANVQHEPMLTRG